MINLPIYPILIPLLTAVVLMFFPTKIRWQRSISVVGSLVTLGVSVWLLSEVITERVIPLYLGSWEAPYGITLVADGLASLLVLTASIISFTALLYAFRTIGEERERHFFYPVFQFLLVGVNGAFLTGDIFNLFVFFEVMLMSSYVLLVLGGTRVQLRESLKYILVNVISSALFVSAVAYLYSVTGTLNMADLGQKVADSGQPGILTVIAILFLIVFGMKGSFFPLHFWLPGSYNAPPIAILTVFGALLTKVGIYSILRTYTIIFPYEPAITHAILGTLSILTILVGVIGAIAYWDVKKIIIYNIIVAVGVIGFGISTGTETGISGSIFYIIHDMLVKGALFLCIGMLMKVTGTSDLKKMGGVIREFPGLGWTFFVAALSLAGIPPLSGFVGKLLIVQAGFESGQYVGSFVVLLSSLLVLFSVMKIFLNGFWGPPHEVHATKHAIRPLLVPAILLVALASFYGVGTQFIEPIIAQATETLINPSIYIDAVLKE